MAGLSTDPALFAIELEERKRILLETLGGDVVLIQDDLAKQWRLRGAAGEVRIPANVLAAFYSKDPQVAAQAARELQEMGESVRIPEDLGPVGGFAEWSPAERLVAKWIGEQIVGQFDNEIEWHNVIGAARHRFDEAVKADTIRRVVHKMRVSPGKVYVPE